MNILFIWDSDYPWDIRVSKICNTLVENGDNIHLVCRNKKRWPVNEFYKGLNIHRVSYLPPKYGKLNNAYNFPMFFNPVWLYTIYKVAKHSKISVIIVRDLPMSLSAIFIGKILKLPVIFDMAECYPELIRLIWKFEPFNFMNIFIRNTLIVDIIEKYALRRFDHIWAMVEESKKRLVDRGIEEDKITIVSNTPIIDRYNVSKENNYNASEDELLLLYVGYLDYSRGIDTLIEATKILLEREVKVTCSIVGTGNAEMALKNKVNKIGLSDRVRFEGWVDNKEVPSYILRSDICFVPHHKCSHWDNTIPNKLFDYMAAAKPVVVSDVVPMKRIVSETGCGFVFESGNKTDLTEKILLLTEPNLRHEMGERGRSAVTIKYNWRNEINAMFDSINKVTKSKNKKTTV